MGNTSKEGNNVKEGNHIETTTTTGSAKNPWEEKEGNVLRNKEPARGIFANIDFDAFNKRTAQKRPRSPSKSPPPEVKKEKKNESLVKPLPKARSESSSSDDGFGPALPPSMRVEKVDSITIVS